MKIKKLNKKGFELVFSTWVIIILSILMLVFLIYFFAMGSGSFLDNIKGYFSKTNVDSVIKSCNFLVDSNSGYEFCCDEKTLKYKEDSFKEIEITCDEFSKLEISNNEIKGNIKCSDINC